jgi:spermidine/putrescine transport system ATP-binding protein
MNNIIQTVDVELDNISKLFGKHYAVKDVDLKIYKGEFFTLLGPSGSGKSTLLRMIAGFEEPSSGVIYLGGKDVTQIPPNRRPTSTVFQNYALFPHMNVTQNVEYGLMVRGVPKSQRSKQVVDILGIVQLADKASRNVRTLSGGEQQRVALARSIITRPTVLLLDESLGALDEKLRKEMQSELKRLQREVGITFIYVTHVQEEALSMSDRIGILAEGKLEQVGTPEEIYYQPRTSFVADFIGSANLLTGTGRRLDEHKVEVLVGGIPVTVDSISATFIDGEEVTICIRPEKISLGSVASIAENQISGRIEAELFKGLAYQYQVRLTTGHVIRAQVQSRVEGSEVLVGWRSSDAILVE